MDNEYERCKKHGHTWQVNHIQDGPDGFVDFEIRYECLICGATAEGQLDVRTDDGRYIEWVV